MDFALTAEQIAIRDDAASFARELNVAALETDAAAEFPTAVWSELANRGWLGLMVPEQLGGMGLDVMTSVLTLEGFGLGCEDNGLALALNSHIWTIQHPIMRFGSEDQKQRYLPAMSRGEILGAHAITEPESGSDTYSMTTSAKRSDGGYVLNGTKSFVGFGPICDFALVFGSSNPDVGQWGVTAFLVDADTDGFIRGEPVSKVGTRSLPMGFLHFENCWVPEGSRLGAEGAGFGISTDSLEWERAFILTSHVGAMQRQLTDTISYARTREQFGQSIGKFQSVSNRLADMKMRLEIARLLLYRAASLKTSDESIQLEAALTNLFISEAFVDSSLDSIRVHGGRGYLTETGLGRDLRDSLGGVIYAGTSDIQRQVIARLLGL